MQVADDGRGMQDLNRIGYGLLGITERVKTVGGGAASYRTNPAAVSPLRRPPVQPESDAAATSLAEGRAMKILIVDDHPIVRAGLRRLWPADRGMEVREAASAKRR